MPHIWIQLFFTMSPKSFQSMIFGIHNPGAKGDHCFRFMIPS